MGLAEIGRVQWEKVEVVFLDLEEKGSIAKNIEVVHTHTHTSKKGIYDEW